MIGRPELRTSYKQDMALFDTPTKWVGVGVVFLVALGLTFALTDDYLTRMGLACAAAIGAIGLNIITGYAGQVSLGHAFFFGVGVYTAAVIGTDPRDTRVMSLGFDNILIWLPAAGLVAGLAGALVAPLASRLRGLYLAVVTLGLVFIGLHVFYSWHRLTGGPSQGRETAPFTAFGYRLDVDHKDANGNLILSKAQAVYMLMLVLLVIFAVAARNIARSRVGRAFTAIRDRDIAAGVIGVNVARYKTVAFAVSSFYAGCAGALFYGINGFVSADSFNLELSVQYIVMVLIGGAGTISGSIAGATLIIMLPKITQWMASWATFISTSTTQTPNTHQLEFVLYGVLVIVFLIFEPRGLYGIWVRMRNYWKSFPFSY